MKQLSTFFAMLLVSVLLIGSSTFAQITWTAGNSTSNWNTPSNWSGNTVPTTNDNVVIPNVTPLPKLDAAGGACKGLTVDANASVDLAGLTLAASGAVTISGTISSSTGSGTLTVGGNLTIMSGGKLDALNIPTISLKGNWTNSGTFVLGTPTDVTFNGTTAQTITTPTTFYDLTSTNGVGVFLGSNNIVVTGQLDLSGGILNAGSASIQIAGSNPNPMLVATGSFTASTSTVSFTGNASATIPSTTFYNLDLNHSGTTFISSALVTVGNNLSITNGTFDIYSKTATVNVGGNFVNSAGTFKATGAGTMNFNGTSTQQIAGVAYNTLQITNTKGLVSLAASASVTDLNMAGNLSDAGNQFLGTGIATVSSGTLTLGGTTATTFPYAAASTSIGNGSTVEYASSAAQTVAKDLTYYNLILDAGTKNAAGGFTATTVTNKSTFVGSGVTTVNGWWVGANGTCTAGTVTFAGAASHTVDGTTFYNLTVDGNGTNDELKPSAGITITKNFLLLNGGKFTGGSYNHMVKGNWDDAAGTFDNTGTTEKGTITFAGTSVITSGTTNKFYNFAVTSAGTVTPYTGLTIANNMSNAGTFFSGTNSYTVGGNWTSASNSGSFSGNSTVIFDNTGSVDSTKFYNMTVSAKTRTAAMSFSATHALTVKNGATLDFDNFAATGAGTFTVEANGTLVTKDANGFNATSASTGAVQMTGGRIYTDAANYTYNGTAAQLVGTASNTVGNLTINNSAGVTLNSTATTTISGTLYLTKGTLSKGTGQIDFVAGPAGTISRADGSLGFVPTGSTSVNVVYSGASSAITAGNELPNGSSTNNRPLNNLIINNASGVTFTAGGATTVLGALTLTSGVLHANSTLTLGGSATATTTNIGSTSYVDGNLNWMSDGATTVFSHTFPIGTGSDSRPVKLELNQNTVSVATYSVEMKNGTPPNNLSFDATLGKVSDNRYYVISGGVSAGIVATPGVTVTLAYGSNDGVSDATNLRLAGNLNNTTTWADLGGNGTAVPNGTIFNATGATTLGNFALATKSGTNNILPVELTSFFGTSKEDNIALSWTTATEVNSSKFVVERKAAAADSWTEVGEVQAAGNSNAPKTYSFMDKNVTGAGSFDYKLSYVDVNGNSHAFGKTISVDVNVPESFSLSQNYPNPFNPSTVIKYALPQAAHVTLKIYNMLGQEVATIVNQQADKGFYKVTWDGRTSAGSYAASGVYIYRIVAGNFVQTKKMNLLK